jgi:hypothetical protein
MQCNAGGSSGYQTRKLSSCGPESLGRKSQVLVVQTRDGGTEGCSVRKVPAVNTESPHNLGEPGLLGHVRGRDWMHEDAAGIVGEKLNEL